MKTKPKKIKNFAVFVLTHKRPKKQLTLKTLDRLGYTGKTYLVVDDEDPTLKKYRKRYGGQVVTFNKKSYLGKFDLMTNDVRYNIVTYARNAVFDIAKKLGLDYMIVLDDDYTGFYLTVDSNGFYKNTQARNLDKLFKAHLKFLESSKIDVLAFAQAGDFIGGENGGWNRADLRPRRKAMNVFFFRTDNPITFNGTINEDSVMGVQVANEGKVVLTNCLVKMIQVVTQKAEGGLTDIYKDVGTYQKSFYTLMASPSSTKVMYQRATSRVHHFIVANNAYPCIVSEKYKKR